jgi:hypothetical protein
MKPAIMELVSCSRIATVLFRGDRLVVSNSSEQSGASAKPTAA